MAKPSTDPTFATDATYTLDGDAWSGANTKVAPGAARRAEGWEPDLLPAEWLNHEMNSHGEHISYIEDVLEATDTIPLVTRTLIIPLGLFIPKDSEAE